MFVTGGASGLGEATVRLLYSKGALIAIADLNEDKLAAIQKDLPLALVLKCDVSKEADVKAAIDATVAKFGTIHVALASAGIAPLTMTLTSKTSLNM